MIASVTVAGDAAPTRGLPLSSGSGFTSTLTAWRIFVPPPPPNRLGSPFSDRLQALDGKVELAGRCAEGILATRTKMIEPLVDAHRRETHPAQWVLLNLQFLALATLAQRPTWVVVVGGRGRWRRRVLFDEWQGDTHTLYLRVEILGEFALIVRVLEPLIKQPVEALHIG